MRLLSRYVLRQLAAPFVFAVAALTSVMLLNQIARRFGALVGKGLPWRVIGEVFLLSLPFIVAMTLPMAVLLAVLYAFSTMASANEITAMRASGVSIGQLLRPVFLAALVLTAVDYVFVDQGLPAANLRLKALIFDIGRKRPTLEFNEQVINNIPPSAIFLRAGRIAQSDGRMKDVTIYDMTEQDERRVIYADSGRMGFEANQRDLYLKLWAGSILQFKGPDAGLFQLTYFDVNTLRVRSVGNSLERNDADVPKSDREMTTCEMLTVVRDTSAAEDILRRRRAGLLEADLRALLGLPPSAVSTPTAPDGFDGRSPGRRPGAPGSTGPATWILPETAQAQAPAQDTSRLKPWKRKVIQQGARDPNATADPSPVTALRAPGPGGAADFRTAGPTHGVGGRVQHGGGAPVHPQDGGRLPGGGPQEVRHHAGLPGLRAGRASRWRSGFRGAAWGWCSAGASASSRSTTSASPPASRSPTPASCRPPSSCGDRTWCSPSSAWSCCCASTASWAPPAAATLRSSRTWCAGG